MINASDQLWKPSIVTEATYGEAAKLEKTAMPFELVNNVRLGLIVFPVTSVFPGPRVNNVTVTDEPLIGSFVCLSVTVNITVRVPTGSSFTRLTEYCLCKNITPIKKVINVKAITL